MYYLPTSSLILLFLISLFYPFPCASSQKELEWCQTLFQCGNITAGFPFSGGNRPQICGHQLLELHCFNNTTSIIISDHLYNVLHIDQTSKTIKLARADLQGSFCNATFTSTTLPSEIFELSSTYKSLTVFYLCDPKLSYHSSYICPGRGPVSVSQNLDYHKSCQNSFMINVPKSFVPEEKELNLAHLESALREGFEVKVKIDEKACQTCSSSHGICGFENTTQICCKEAASTRCNKLHPPDATELELHKRCSGPFSCGDQRELFYPFWTSDREGCGHPEFKLNCSGGIAELSISSVKFRILEANYGSEIIRLARLDYINDDLCPQDPIDALFDENILPFAPNTELLTFYYNCSRDFSQRVSTYVGELACGDDSENEKYYYVTRNLSSPLLREIGAFLSDLRGSCNRNVTIPASGPALNELQITSSSDNLKKALEYGFELGPNQECLKCIGDAGACGYNQSSNSFVCYRIEEPQNRPRNKGQNNLSILILIGLCSLTGVIAFLVLLCPCFGVQIFRKRKTLDDLRREKLKSLIPLKSYTYAQVKKITKSFAEVIGRGGFGIVYKGTQSDGCMVAVKVLKESKGNDCEDFINEVASMSKTSHVNIVSLLGFCSEGSKRAIIYEFLGNGSLDNFISDKTSMNLDLMALYGIALGVARGLEYLHYGCKTRIVHFDIKPQNVLLDDNLCPKVSDFGLAKLCEKKESILSLLDTRGTIGYIAPEMISRVYGSVSHKSDVYSYGMLVLEMIGARKKEKVDLNSVSNASSIYFPEWIYKDLEKADSEDIEKTYNGGIIENGINSEEEEIVKKMTLVGLWCIQSSPSNRPPMNKVVEMMEGSLEALEVPPRPVLQQISAASLSESFWISEENSSASDIPIGSTN